MQWATYWQHITRQAQRDANATLPLDNQEVAVMAHRAAQAYSPDTDADRHMLEAQYRSAFLHALAARASERGMAHVLPGENDGNPVMERIERERYG
jgi:hypothetical protein